MMVKLLSKYRSEIMGICIIWIMLFHSGIDAPDNMFFRALWYLFVSFGGGIGVDIFLICSGFGLRCSECKKASAGKQESDLSFYKRRVVRLLPAYCAVAVCYYALLKKSTGEIIYNVLFLNFILEGKRDFWYIFASIIFYLLFPLYGKAAKRVNYRWATALFCFVSIAITMLIYWTSPMYYELWEILLWRLPCFWIGCYFGDLFVQNRDQEFKTVVIGAAVLGICLIIGLGLISAPGAILRNEFTLLSPAIMVFFCLLLGIVEKALPALNAILSYFGSISLELYVIHVSLGGFFARLIGEMADSEMARLSVYFILSILLAAALHHLIDMFSKKKVAISR